jgi:hypothetical protein
MDVALPTLPSTAPVFLAFLAVHVLAGLTCAVTGAAAALTRKGSGHHRRLGSLYFRALCVVFATALVLAGLRWPHDNHLAALGTVSFAGGLVGYLARRRHWPGDRAHILGLGTSYIALLTAFYVDNGKQLPLWDRLPTIVYWLGPTLIGVPLMIRAIRKRRDRRNLGELAVSHAEIAATSPKLRRS